MQARRYAVKVLLMMSMANFLEWLLSSGRKSVYKSLLYLEVHASNLNAIFIWFSTCRPYKRKFAASSPSWMPCNDSLSNWLPMPARRVCRFSNPNRTLCAAALRMRTLLLLNDSAHWHQHCSTDVTSTAAWMMWRNGWRRCSESWTQAVKSTLMKSVTHWLSSRYCSFETVLFANLLVSGICWTMASWSKFKAVILFWKCWVICFF